MEKKKNIISLSGQDRIGCQNELDKLLRAFRERQSDMNIETFRFDEITSWNEIQNKVLSLGLFVEKRLFVFQGDFIPKSEKKGKSKTKNAGGEESIENFIKLLENIDDETFIIIFPLGGIPEVLQDWIKHHASERTFDDIFSRDNWQSRYPTLDGPLIDEVIAKHRQLYALYEEGKKPKHISIALDEAFQKLELLKDSNMITRENIEESISISGTGRMFDLTDSILDGNTKKALNLFRILLGETDIYGVLPNFIGALRSSIYVRFLKEKGLSESAIGNILKIHPYVLKKAYNSRISWEKLSSFYDKMILVNIAYKSGKGLHDPELGRIFTIERAIMTLKK